MKKTFTGRNIRNVEQGAYIAFHSSPLTILAGYAASKTVKFTTISGKIGAEIMLRKRLSVVSKYSFSVKMISEKLQRVKRRRDLAKFSASSRRSPQATMTTVMAGSHALVTPFER